ncbi:class I SAM-dependent methyltransferase [Salibacteraceae bacterium]|nr:hypothetical protein [Crocinitomicaceae bacterium]MCH9822951.1 class I SAM-dependent methyltransferase [Bacteroidota bacterium]MDB9725229.1 class I SAM-dependent methyltransferase [Salibacteraceae bacterium]MDB9984068.1 class I SAM-dependent methyltransferase [bacterium]
MTGYDYIAPFYQFFSKLVFGDLLFEAQTLFLTKDLTPNKILIVGGGTGELLSFCLNQYPAVRITYVESSKKMIELSKKKISRVDNARVDFQCKSIFDWESKMKFDAVLLPFVLDLFSELNCQKLIAKTKYQLESEGRLVVADFSNNTSSFQNLLIGFMYKCFDSINAVERNSLPDYESIFRMHNLKIEKDKKLGKKLYKDLLVAYQLAL